MEIKNILLMVLVTFAFVALFIPVVKKIAEFIGAMDIPNERKIHKVPMPRLGGLGIYAGFLLGYILFGMHSIKMNAILIGSFIIIITGIFIVINIIGKCVAPHILVQEYAKYGPDVESSVTDKIDTDKIVNEVKESAPFNEDMFRLVIILIIGIFAALIISELTTKKSSPAKKK